MSETGPQRPFYHLWYTNTETGTKPSSLADDAYERPGTARRESGRFSEGGDD
ncbi:hypothetical protein NJ7G_3180 [Natrinema sp. J7-2]|nr:hypothetical protein NJ7G_3180 [Natrinema sp. J7-2]